MNTYLPNIASVSEFQRDYVSLLKRLKEEKRPLMMLKNNKVQAVMLDPSFYDNLITTIEHYEIEDAKNKIAEYKAERTSGKLKKAKGLKELFS